MILSPFGCSNDDRQRGTEIFMKHTFFIVLLWSLLATAQLGRAADNTNTVLSLEDARHLITRTGLGASPAELNRFIGLTQIEAVNKIIADLSEQPNIPAPAWTDNAAPQHFRFGTMTVSEKQQFRQIRQSEMQSLRRWWIQEMISTPSPQTERLVLFWHNHFATGFSGVNNQSISIARQHLMFRKHSAGNFRAFLKNIIRDPAMLNYLDNNNSKKQKPNENLAREILELFTLGEGNYTESDIKNAARALTGYSFSNIYDMQFVFENWSHDKKDKTIFGKTGNFNGDDLVDLILEQPEAARFITAKMWRLLVGDINSTDDKLTAHASAFRDSDYEIKTLYKSILLSNDFWHTDNRASIVQSPVSLSIGAIRSSGILPPDWQTLPAKLQLMGQHLFEPPNVAGWPGGSSWITPGRLLARLEWLEQLGIAASASSPNINMAELPANMSGKSSEQAHDQSMQASQSMMSDSMTGKHELAIRMAAEEFDEHVRYLVKVYSHTGHVWESGELELKGGHDTRRMGRVQRNDIPWQTITFPVDIASDNVSAIEVSFINDGTTPAGADRNLYINRASLGDRVWLSRDGKQTGKCARKRANQQGNLYCPGTLRMEQSTTSSANINKPLAANTMRASSATLRFARPLNLAFTLSDVEFEGRFWDTLSFNFIKHKTDGYALRLNNIDCWPKCLIEWPECAWENRHFKTISIGLNTKKQLCMYKGLQAPDKKLVHALWMLLDDLYETTGNGPKINRPNVARNFSKWQSDINEMTEQLPSSTFYDPSIQLEVVPRPMIDTTLAEAITDPQPAGLTEEQRNKSLKLLLQNHPELNLTTLLLPTNPVNPLTSSNAEFYDVITDLAFQLK